MRMAPYGEIIGRNPSGDLEVRPLDGSPKIKLIGSSGLKLNAGVNVFYDRVRGDTAYNYWREEPKGSMVKKVKPISDDERDAVTNRALFAIMAASLEERIPRILGELDTSGANALVLYDPKQSAHEYHFIAIARTRDRIREVIYQIYDWGFGGDSNLGINLYEGKNGLFWGRHHVVKDFRNKVATQPHQVETLFVPLEGLVKTESWLSEIPEEIFRLCVESARLK